MRHEDRVLFIGEDGDEDASVEAFINEVERMDLETLANYARDLPDGSEDQLICWTEYSYRKGVNNGNG